ncbi:NAD(P)H-binding protein [Halobacillus sp. BAB-2008]|uniref:NAD(P)H-binding protein n=1 Tax=Halobacillus sp. BAB-2008 TaxID=1246484 RepID=UPI0005870FEC|nr:NAD(P)H-binding protein [Halobacillus sp. BAB-2008]
MTEPRKKVVVAGASGYIGRNLMKKLVKNHDIIALSRNGDDKEDETHIHWKSCDLYSLIDAERGLEGADIAVYLVHSMLPSAKLTQGSFEDMDVILADNFAQAAKKQGVQQIIYLSGIVPDDGRPLSPHLRSRLEVEEILGAYGTPVTTIRAGLIVGPSGSSFPILKNLVKRLPFMVLPRWTRTKTQPIALPDVLTTLDKSIDNRELAGKAVDVGGPEVMTYEEMMAKLAAVMNRSPKMIDVPFLTIQLSKLWVRLVTGSPKEMVYPLIESLVHPMIVQEENRVKGLSEGSITFEEAARAALEEEAPKKKGRLKPKFSPIQQDVRSVQRIPLPTGHSADWIAKYYVRWLERVLNPWVKTTVFDASHCRIGVIFNRTPLLELTYAADRSTRDRALYYISGGVLADVDKNERGRLEFRKIPGKNEAIVAIHDYMPSIPWFFYKYTQAKAHLLVMHCFRRHLEKWDTTPPVSFRSHA